MKRIIKLNLLALVMLIAFISEPEKIHGLTEEVAEEIVVNDLVIVNAILQVEVYLNEYLKEFPAAGVEVANKNLKAFLMKKLEADDFTEEEIIKIIETIANNRMEEIVDLVELYLKENIFLSKNIIEAKLGEAGYLPKEIEKGLAAVEVDWIEQAVQASEEYINTEVAVNDESYLIISRKCLNYFLIEEKDFTVEEAAYGIEEAEITWKKQAVKQAKYYLTVNSYSKNKLIEKLLADEFSIEEAEYGVATTQTNWKEQAKNKAESYMIVSSIQSKKGLARILKQDGFSEAEIAHAMILLFREEQENGVKVDDSSIITPENTVPERPMSIKPLKLITSHIIVSAEASSDKPTARKSVSANSPSSTETKKITSSATENEAREDIEEATSLFDQPVFAPVILVLVVGNLYLFQKS